MATVKANGIDVHYVMEGPAEGKRKPTIHLDEEAVRRAEEKGEGL